jgi:hypothetical protein
VAAPTNPETKVITGHFGLGAAAKAVDQRAPLWSLMLATQWLDVIFVPLALLGVETIDTLPGGGYGNVIIHAITRIRSLAHLSCRLRLAPSLGGGGTSASACCSAASHSRTGYSI